MPASVGRATKGAYYDSVTLMKVGRRLTEMPGVLDAAVVMGTDENKAILDASGLMLPEFEGARGTDLLIAVKADDSAIAGNAIKAAEALLDDLGRTREVTEEYVPASLGSALGVLPDANLALISVAGRYAGDVAAQALARGVNVMLFSDNVPIETEIELKRRAHDNGLLVMGPDCGTAIINGVPLAFANVVTRGDIGIVAASGTGAQEVSSIISNEGCGVSQVIGTGGRDVKSDVGGVTFLDALAMLSEDEATRVIVLVSKPPDDDVLERIAAAVSGVDKPVVSIFLGADSPGPGIAATTLEQAALMAVSLSKGRDVADASELLKSRGGEIEKIADREAKKRTAGRRYARGLMSGGTFCSEAQLIFVDTIGDVFSNAPVRGASGLEDPLASRMNTVVDLGADEFTVGRPHPMIDYSLRKRRIVQEAQDPETAVILLDVVLGHGSNQDPAGELCDVLREASRTVSVVCSVTGTDGDPQNRRHVTQALTSAGACVMPSNAAASRLTARIVQRASAP